MAAAAVQGEQLNKILQCSICIDVVTDPRTLPCLHTFCFMCIADWCKDRQPGEEVTCPECRGDFVIPDSGIDGLKKNFFVANLLSMNEVKHKSEDLCEICVGEDNRVSEMFCLQCEQGFCKSCSKGHLKTKNCKFHKLVCMDELQSGVDIKKKYRTQYCDKHTDKLIELYCLDDEVAICIMCCILDHRSHCCEEIKNTANQFRSAKWKQDLQTALSEIEEKFEVLNTKKLIFCDKMKIVENEICQEADKKIQLIVNHKEKLFSLLHSIKTHHEREIDEVNQELTRAKALLSTFKDYCEELLNLGSDVDICQERKSICGKTEELVNMKDLEDSLGKLGVTNVMFTSSSGTFEDSKIALGDLKAVKSGVLNESKDKMMLQGTSPVTEESGVFSESKHKSLLPVTPAVTDNTQFLFTLNQPNGFGPCQVSGVAMLDDKRVYVVYWECNKVQVFHCEDRLKKNKDIRVDRMRLPDEIVGCSETSQLFVSDRDNRNIRRVNVNTGVSDVFIKLGYNDVMLSLVENRLLVTSPDLLLMYDIHSGERKKSVMKSIPLTENMKYYGVEHAIESDRDSFFVSHLQSNRRTGTVSEIDSEGRVIRVFKNKEKFDCRYLALASAGRLLVADCKNNSVFLLDQHLQFIKILLDKERLDNARLLRLNYNKNNNRLAVGLDNGNVKIFDCRVY